MYILDTNTVIYFFKGLGNVASNLLAQQPNDLGLPAIVLYEMELGIAKSSTPRKRIAQLNQLVSTIQVLPFSREEAKASATIRAILEKKGTPIGPHDTLIAGTAMAHQGILVTHNAKEFNRVRGLKTEDWY